MLSPCVTFRPEQRQWKELVRPAPVAETDDPARAARRIMLDDGFNIGVLYAGARRPYARASEAGATLADIEGSSRYEQQTPPDTSRWKPLMAQALVMEREAVARYTELAEMMETHNNLEVAALFRKMAEYEGHHVAQIQADMGWADDSIAARQAGAWATAESPESVPVDEMHYLMHPWHALQLALAAEQRAVSVLRGPGAARDHRHRAPRGRGDARRGGRARRAGAGVARRRCPSPRKKWPTPRYDPPRYID